jgi:orotidine-5'-phosphate decarboxylase
MNNPIIIALDVESAAQARVLVDSLGSTIDFYKVGMELYAAEGMSIVHELIGEGKQVFLDLKLYDIGETVKRATARVAGTGVRFLTIHSSPALMRAADEGRGNSGLQLLAVSVLTSFSQQDAIDLGHTRSIEELVELRVRNAVVCGMDGIVCSPLEARGVREIAGPEKLIVTPGVRSERAGLGDQKRVATPAEAVAAGANYVVVGRQVTRAKDPRAEALRIVEEIEAVLPSPIVHDVVAR